jgi:cell division transport system permease protein
VAISFDYTVRETFSNLRRNPLMTMAAVLTVAVSLSLVGGALLLKQGVTRATLQWRGGVELSIFMKPDASPAQNTAVQTELANLPQVRKFTYVDQQASFAEFQEMFSNDPSTTEGITAADLPPSYRVVPKEAEFVEPIGSRFEERPGVFSVAYAKDTIDTLLKVTRIIQLAIYTMAGVLLISATLLILNTIQLAIFARRREIAVMKLVGATNWFIRIPFMLEGLVQGLVGGGVAALLVTLGRTFLQRNLESSSLQLIQQMLVSGREVAGTAIFLVVVGAAVGALGSAVAVRRFLDV